MVDQGRANNADTESVRWLRGTCTGHFLGVDGLLDQRGSLSTVLLRPVDAHQAAGIELALPGAAIGKLGILVLRGAFLRNMRFQPAPQFLPVLLIFRGKSEVHVPLLHQTARFRRCTPAYLSRNMRQTLAPFSSFRNARHAAAQTADRDILSWTNHPNTV